MISDPLPKGGEQLRCVTHVGPKAPADARNRENHMLLLLSGPCPCRATSGRGRGGRRRRAEKAVCTAPGGSVQEVSVQPLPVRVNAV